MAVKLIVLDVDDTLYLERDYVRSGFHAVARHLGDPGFARVAWAEFEAGTRGNIFDVALAQLPPEVGGRTTVRELVEVYRNHMPEIALCEDAEEFRRQVEGRFDLGVVTDGPAASQNNKITALGLRSWISECVVTGERGDGWPKPSTRGFLYLQEHFGRAGDECVYLADNPAKDFTGPQQLGWHTIRVRRPGGLHKDVPHTPDNPADHDMADLCQAVELIRQLG